RTGGTGHGRPRGPVRGGGAAGGQPRHPLERGTAPVHGGPPRPGRADPRGPGRPGRPRGLRCRLRRRGHPRLPGKRRGSRTPHHPNNHTTEESHVSTGANTPDPEELNKLIRYTMWSVFRVDDITALDRAAAADELTGLL